MFNIEIKISVWGSGCRKVIKEWYLKKDVKTLAEIISKNKRFHGWSHKDVIKLIHLKTDEPGKPFESHLKLIRIFLISDYIID